MHWLWVRDCSELSAYLVHERRNRAACDELLGELPAGAAVISDDYSVYKHVPPEQRQLCWAHLIRELERLSESSEPAVTFIADKLLACARRLFVWRRRVRDGTLGLGEFAQYMQSLQATFTTYCGLGAKLRSKKPAGFYRRLAVKQPMYFTFVRYPLRIDPTNNGSERALRHAVIWRKLSFGTRDEWGKLFVQRMLTVIATCRKQGRSVFEFVYQALLAQRHRAIAPSLLAAR